MFHAFDKLLPGGEPARPQWMALLARAPLDLLKTGLGEHAHHSLQWLRAPETGLVMVQGRVGGTGQRFNLGEITVTRCTLRLDGTESTPPTVGVAYVLGRSHQQARLAAVADALLQVEQQRLQLQTALLEPIVRHLSALAAQRSADAQSTQVEFFTLARQAGGADDTEDEA